jgi:hypothetical protein
MLTASVDLSKSPIELTVTSDKRQVSVQVTVLGETVPATGKFPITVTDADRTWKIKSDDGKTAVYTA